MIQVLTYDLTLVLPNNWLVSVPSGNGGVYQQYNFNNKVLYIWTSVEI